VINHQAPHSWGFLFMVVEVDLEIEMERL